MAVYRKNIISGLLSFVPLFILFFLVFSETEFDFEKFSFLSFNLTYILIFFWVLKNPQILGYGFIFLAGIINDVVIGLPVGISSITYLILSGFAAYIRNLTVQPTLFSDWGTFLPSVVVTNAVYFVILNIFFGIGIDYIKLLINSGITIAIYPLFWILFNLLARTFTGGKNV